MDIQDAFTPSLLLPESHFVSRRRPGYLAAAAERVAAEGFFRHIELMDLETPAERRRVRKVVEEHGIDVTTWAIVPLEKARLSLSAMNADERKTAVSRTLDILAGSAESGASVIGVASGPDRGRRMRASATQCLEESLDSLCRAAAGHGMRVVLEPFDRGADKNALIGPVAELVPLVRRLRERHANIGVCWETAHLVLGGDALLGSLEACADLVAQVHLSNAVVKKGMPGFGDHHMAIGPPGFLTEEEIAQALRRAVELGVIGSGRKPPIAVGVRSGEGDDPWENVAMCEQVLRRAWEASAAGEALDEGSQTDAG